MSISVDKINQGSKPTGIGRRFQGRQPSQLKDVLNFSEKYVVTGVNYLSAASGTLSFLLHNVIKKPSELIDAIGTWSSKAGVLAVALFGGATKLPNKDAFGIAAFAMDFLAPIIGTGEDLYQWKGWGSGTDQTIPILTEIAYNPKIKEEYKLKDGKETEFNKYKSFSDSLKKTCSGIRIITSDIVDEFKKNGFSKAFMNCFINGGRTAEKNLLVSGVGIVFGAFLSTIMGLKKFGSTIRDSFGIYGDLAYIDKGRSKVSGKVDVEAKKEYLKAGIFYTIGSVLDLVYRWKETPGLNLFALGIDRLGHCSFVKGVARDVKENNPTPSLATY